MKKTILTAFAVAATCGTAALAPAAQAADVPGVAFVYLGNPGDAGWTFAHDQGSKVAEQKFGNKIKITRVENVPESADSERVFRDLDHFRHELRLSGFPAEGGEGLPGHRVPACDRLQEGAELRHL
jgi:basic membrane lipoprotein Med (substrate-binding protein (PBP1-ABC) superfamily)